LCNQGAPVLARFGTELEQPVAWSDSGLYQQSKNSGGRQPTGSMRSARSTCDAPARTGCVTRTDLTRCRVAMDKPRCRSRSCRTTWAMRRWAPPRCTLRPNATSGSRPCAGSGSQHLKRPASRKKQSKSLRKRAFMADFICPWGEDLIPASPSSRQDDYRKTQVRSFRFFEHHVDMP
jgi:hypothetical protein